MPLASAAPQPAAPPAASTTGSPPVPVAEDHAARSEFVYYAHSNLQDMVKFADQKAATIIGGGGIIVAVLGSSLIEKCKDDPVLRWAGLLSFFLMVAAVFCAVFVLRPHRPPAEIEPAPSAPRLFWASDIAAYRGRSEDYLAALASLQPATALADLAFENQKISSILEKKWCWQRWATRFLLAAFPSWMITLGIALMR